LFSDTKAFGNKFAFISFYGDFATSPTHVLNDGVFHDQVQFVENIYFALQFINIDVNFCSHAGEVNLKEFLPKKGRPRIIVVRPMKRSEKVHFNSATLLPTGGRHLRMLTFTDLYKLGKQKNNSSLPLRMLVSLFLLEFGLLVKSEHMM